MDEDEERPLRAAELEALAEKRREELEAAGEDLRPVVSRTRALATRFWGKAWMRHLAACESGGLCLAPGRTLLRHGCVLDLRIAPGFITAKVSGRRLEEVELRIAPLDDERIETLAEACHGRIDSVVSLLEGKLDEAVLGLLCDSERGLLPDPADWRMACSCPDWSEPCAHAAAAIYAAGALIDEDPSLLFTLRALDPGKLMAGAAPTAKAEDFSAGKLGKLFGIDLDVE